MKRIFFLLFTLVLIYTPLAGHTGPKEDYEEAYKLYITAGTSVAAYDDRIGELTNHYIEQDGWKIDHYLQPEGHNGARFVLAQKSNQAGGTTYIIAIVGTETPEDIKMDLNVDKVYFSGTNLEEFAANAAKKDVPNTEPKVHRGFNEFVQAGPAATLRNVKINSDLLIELIKNNKNNKLFLTGHSLGGAAATLAGARLLSSGINPDQIEVITFGAPAVGNAAFAAKFNDTLHLTRVVNSGDVVTGLLQTLVGGYQQFGREIKWNLPDTLDEPHNLTAYVDSALKNYYDKRRQAIQAGINLPEQLTPQQTNFDRIYIAPLQNSLPHQLTADFRYMCEALGDEHRQTLPNSIIASNSTPLNWQQAATASNCRLAILSEVSAVRLKQEKNTYHIILNQTVYDVTTGAIVNMATFSTATYNLTPLEAFIHDFKDIRDSEASWLKQKSSAKDG
jgi:hypothetical protein